MGKIIFYILNFVGITVYFLFNRKGNVDSPLLMMPYIIAVGIIFLAVMKYLMQNKPKILKQVFETVIILSFCIVLVYLYSNLISDSGSFNYLGRINSLRRYFGVFIFFLAFIGLNSIKDLRKISLADYLKFVIFLVGGEAIIEFILLNTGVISLLNLPVILGAEYIGAHDVTFRPYGFLGATSALGVFLLILFYLSYGLRDELPKWTWILSFVAFAMCFSVTSYAIFIIVSVPLVLFKMRSPSKMLLASVLVGGSIVGMVHFFNLFIKGKMNLEYFSEIICVVWANDIKHYCSFVTGFWDVILGAQPFDSSFGLLSQDLPYVSWLGEVGLLGIAIYSYFIVKILVKLDLLMPKKYIYAVILCIFLGMLHYPIIVFIPTQLFLGSLLFFAQMAFQNRPSGMHYHVGNDGKTLKKKLVGYINKEIISGA